MLIYETKYFILETHESPEIDRLEGGHVKISPKRHVVDRTELSAQEAIDLVRLTIIAGRAMVDGMKKQGVIIGRINYQDNGNWKPALHVHLYCRAVDAVIQKYGDPISPGHKDSFMPLNEEDIKNVSEVCKYLFAKDEYSDSNWGIV